MPDKKILYVDLDNTLVNFQSGIDRLHPSEKVGFENDLDEVPRIFSLMDPLEGALDAYEVLAEKFDTYILSTAPWGNPSAWQHKVEWVHVHFGIEPGSPAYKRLILSHHKHLNRGDFLVDDRPGHNGADRFGGEVVPFGSAAFPDWPTVVDYLRERA